MNNDKRRETALRTAAACLPVQPWSIELTDVTGKKVLLLALAFEVYMESGYEEAQQVLTDRVAEYREKRRVY